MHTPATRSGRLARFLLSLLTAVVVCAPSARCQEPTIKARSAILFDAKTGRVLFKKNENERMPVASTQKLLTALLVAEAGNLDQKVVVKQSDTLAAPTKLYLRAGDSYTRRDLLTAMMVRSPNDVAKVLARDYAGSVEAFCERMNARMRRLGGKDSHFVNPNGLPAEEQFSTARDMARIARTAYFNATLRKMMLTKTFTFKFNSGKTTTLRNTNRVMRTYSFCNGMKTGYTVKSGHCLVSSGSHEGRDVIAVVLGSNKTQVWPESAALLAYGLGLSETQVASLRVDSSP